MNTSFVTAFTDNIITTFIKMADIKLTSDGEAYKDNSDITSFGITSIISFAGKGKGRLLLDIETNLAMKIAKNIMGEDYDNPRDDMLLATIGELNNTITGAAITDINNSFSVSLRLSPPIVFTGKDVVIAIPKINSISRIYTTEYGNLKMNIAFEGGSFDGC
ncbi:chemotaxis protein CheX [Clostridium saccharobutylicum]|uniref:Inhibitor of MCP methylation n=1 Tax=Clostridium saccharobutylicum DSM 13864 TaxID=1345695 RepID=U5MQG4_CLOSA|nr:chemotaxis protein CheX [Clostridium saccharobutylicum]AGX43029.1 inhibitor of MCP methylation [Clostridium saccharobutylicum DSM 13864]AQR90320.1 hypothetical protein CLOSC_20350 [Clostridium saccharobutylicum]AQS00226.1 hypothetical protein CSACC_20420 [Clostridium saccharobutylicum]AQS10025.1 hypothetical protein CLOBY_21640 [Clostridium saccharobutylicum]AQS14209.1 hypothetical protein CLOSACC_20420 [Clostridium saccharobutylicum]